MAVATLKSNAYGFIPDQVPGLSSRMAKGREGTGTQVWNTGAVLLRSSGTIIEASANPVANIVGISAGKAAGVTASEAIFYPATPDFVFQATLEDQSVVDHALVATDIFVAFGTYLDTAASPHWYINFNNTTNKSVVVIAPVNWADVDNATVRARVKCVFLSSITAYYS